jgi:hypothetical protein
MTVQKLLIFYPNLITAPLSVSTFSVARNVIDSIFTIDPEKYFDTLSLQDENKITACR